MRLRLRVCRFWSWLPCRRRQTCPRPCLHRLRPSEHPCLPRHPSVQAHRKQPAPWAAALARGTPDSQLPYAEWPVPWQQPPHRQPPPAAGAPAWPATCAVACCHCAPTCRVCQLWTVLYSCPHLPCGNDTLCDRKGAPTCASQRQEALQATRHAPARQRSW